MRKLEAANELARIVSELYRSEDDLRRQCGPAVHVRDMSPEARAWRHVRAARQRLIDAIAALEGRACGRGLNADQ